ncbi:YtxH domain-containing protein [Dokdonia sp. Hel_I_53]|uniref:YtxH domain-containing protein n=1 Tax=Dokdonia sp. Hel_I_53 TaxID=1566287 RepID=UPI00119949FE|nr:YtxH domain-containing protein [Dokdonia sp. Hel_I_53]TVZ52640.1 YtxH-like protein [Dokdonia sp. Hel_I_53]
MSKSGNTLLALVLGGAIGAAAGVLYAPEKGVKTRKDLSKKARKEQEKLVQQLKETRSSLATNAEKAKLTFEEKLNETINTASHKADDVIGTLESKLADLRLQNSKLQTRAKVDELKAKADKALS